MTDFVSTRCIKCGTPTNGQYCAACSEQKRAEEAQRAERVAQAIAERPAPQSTTGSLCPACGMWASKNARFCGYCRYSFDGTPDVLEASPATVQRIIAGLIDGVVMFVVFTVMALVLAGTETSENGQVVRVTLSNEELLLFVGAAMGYYVALELLLGASLGKLLLGLRVIKVNGEPHDIGAALLRNILRIVDSFPFGFYIVGLVFIASTEKKQRLGDIVAGTAVVKASTAKARSMSGRSPFA
jgi:uncharacterized RDD family membrane protein YckC